MRWREAGLLTVALLGVGCAPVAVQPGAGQPGGGARPGGRPVQVEAGRELAAAQCAACHGAALEGRYGPPLSGPHFQAGWRGRSAADLRAFIAANMPQGRAGTLTDGQTLALVAYILHANGAALPGAGLTPEALGSLTLFSP